jgi:hypothetical protein
VADLTLKKLLDRNPFGDVDVVREAATVVVNE